jgi:hypothetical protein
MATNPGVQAEVITKHTTSLRSSIGLAAEGRVSLCRARRSPAPARTTGQLPDEHQSPCNRTRPSRAGYKLPVPAEGWNSTNPSGNLRDFKLADLRNLEISYASNRTVTFCVCRCFERLFFFNRDAQ